MFNLCEERWAFGTYLSQRSLLLSSSWDEKILKRILRRCNIYGSAWSWSCGSRKFEITKIVESFRNRFRFGGKSIKFLSVVDKKFFNPLLIRFATQLVLHKRKSCLRKLPTFSVFLAPRWLTKTEISTHRCRFFVDFNSRTRFRAIRSEKCGSFSGRRHWLRWWSVRMLRITQLIKKQKKSRIIHQQSRQFPSR